MLVVQRRKPGWKQLVVFMLLELRQTRTYLLQACSCCLLLDKYATLAHLQIMLFRLFLSLTVSRQQAPVDRYHAVAKQTRA